MAGPTALTKTKRFIPEGVTKVYYLPAAANPNALTLAELNAGTDLTTEIESTAGWDVTSNLVPTPDWGSRYETKVSGTISSTDSSITFYGSEDGHDVRTVLPRDTTGFIVWLDGGNTTGNTMDVYPITVSAASKIRAAGAPLKIQVDFAITAQPSENQTIPTA